MSLAQILLLRTHFQRNYSFLLELKSLPYFEGIDWEQVAHGKFEPPFEAVEIEIDEDPLDPEELFEFHIDSELTPSLIDRFRSKFAS